jgi:hypothetical protein
MALNRGVYRPLQETMQRATAQKTLGHTDICMTQQKLGP